MNRYLICFFFQSLLMNVFASDTIMVSKFINQDALFLPPNLKVLEDKGRNISLLSVQKDSAKVFHKPAIESHLGMDGSAWWLRFVIQNDLAVDQTVILEIQHPHINQINYFLTESGNVKRSFTTGDAFEFKNRPIFARNFVFDMRLQSQRIYTVYVYFDNGFEPISLPILLESPSAYAENETKFLSIFFIFSGILLAMTLISFYIFITYKQRLFLFYSLFTLSDLLWATCNYGLGFQWLWPDNPIWDAEALTFFPIMSFVIFIPFLKSIYQAQNISKFQSRLLYLSLIFGLILTFIYPIIYILNIAILKIVFTNVLWAFFLSMFVVYSYVIVSNYVKRPIVSNLFFTLGFILMLIGAVVNVLREIIPMNTYFWVEHGCMIGLFVEVLFTGYAIALNLKTLLNDREKLLINSSNHQKELLKTSILAEEKERKRIAEDLHDDLGVLLSIAKIKASSFKSHSTLVDLIDKSLIKVREVTHKLHPSEIDQFGLNAVLEEFLENLRLTVPFTLEYEVAININVSKEYQVHLFRISTELLNNAVKHSQATHVLFKIETQNKASQKYIRILIEDNGTGIGNKSKTGLGLLNIESRVQVMGGAIEIENLKKGLKIEILIPII
ncbi:MAG: 7TM diverse intracellular signaling domain-containing protein [Bacteroidota bacterium]|nr:7TM diverse intracellular signaling domain-containing protein [Bacteroidota bacterium]